MNWIQHHIILELTRSAERRYSDLRPEGVEGNLFLYYLEGLRKQGLVEKHEKNYRLTQKGLQYAGTVSLETGRPRVQPKVLTAVVAENESGEMLFVRWKRQPNVGQVSLPHGMAHFGRPLAEMASLELAEKADLEGELASRGYVEIIGKSGDEVDRHMIVHVFAALSIRSLAESRLRVDVAEPFWARPDDVPKAEFVPGFAEVLELARGSEAALAEKVVVEIVTGNADD